MDETAPVKLAPRDSRAQRRVPPLLAKWRSNMRRITSPLRFLLDRARMIYLVCQIFIGSTFILLMRFAQKREYDLLNVGGINYIVAGVVAGLMVGLDGKDAYGLAATVTGLFNGAGYFVSFFLLIASMPWKGAALTSAVARLSILLPIVCGVALWGERPSAMQGVGIALACASLLLIGRKRVNISDKESPAWIPLLLVAFFFLTGGSRLAQEAFKHLAPQEERPVFLLALFGLSGGASVIMMLFRLRMPTLTELAFGTVIGLSNVFQTFFLLKALAAFPGFIVFPVTSVGGLVLTAMVAVGFLGERLEKWSYAGLGIATFALVLLNF